eukprot:UN09168
MDIKHKKMKHSDSIFRDLLKLACYIAGYIAHNIHDLETFSQRLTMTFSIWVSIFSQHKLKHFIIYNIQDLILLQFQYDVAMCYMYINLFIVFIIRPVHVFVLWWLIFPFH